MTSVIQTLNMAGNRYQNQSAFHRSKMRAGRESRMKYLQSGTLVIRHVKSLIVAAKAAV